MKHLAITLLLVSFSLVGCGKKDGDKAPPAADKPAVTAPATTTPAANPAPAGAKPTAADLPPECKTFTDRMELLMKCDKLPIDGRESMRRGYDQMLKAMVDLGDIKAMVDGCKQGEDSLKRALEQAGC